jgi:glutamine---fructose-6-phosphate transaminase (isomerizing)
MTTHTHLHQEIHEQPAVLRRLLHEEQATAEALATEMKRRNIQHVIIAARGTSDNAARYANYLLGAHNQLLVSLATPSLYSIYQRPPHLGNALVLGISQSGQSPDIVAVLAEARRQGALTAAITNFPGSALGQQADFVLNLHAGVEKSVAATKTYTSQLAAIALLSTTLSGDPAQQALLAQIPDLAAQTLAQNAPSHIAQIAERYRYMAQCVTIGRGFNYATAFELALKLKELTYTMVEPYSSADFMHGPLALIEHGFPVIVIAPTGIMLPEIKAFMHTLREREAELLVISDDAEALALGRVSLSLPTAVSTAEWLSPLLAIMPGQQFALHLAAAKDYDPDHPRGLKKVTETR